MFYAAFAVPPVTAAWLLTANLAFAGALSATALGIVFFAIHFHDAVHCPGHTRFEKLAFFKYLDRHHYVHHIDTGSNVNFLLPLGDLLMGTLRKELTPREQRRWPSFDEAHSVIHPSVKS